jgi:hypothetical protein
MAEQLTSANIGSWWDWATNYANTRQLFLDNWNALKESRPWVAQHHPELLPQHDAIMQKFRDAVPMIDNLGNIANQVIAFGNGLGIVWKGVTDFGGATVSGIKSGLDWLRGQFGLNGLSALPIIWIGVSVATAAASLYTIAKMVSDAGVYSQRIAALKLAYDKGATSEEAAQIVNSVLGSPGTSITGDNKLFGLDINSLMLGAAALVLGPPIIKAISERRK